MTTVSCLICNGSCVSSRNSIQLFSEETITCSEQPVIVILSKVLDKNVTEDSVHSKVICKKCFKNCDELDELELRCNEIRADILRSYNSSVQKNIAGEVQDEKEMADMILSKPDIADQKLKLKEGIVNNNGTSKNMIDIPSVDDDFSHTLQVRTNRKILPSIEDIELALVKIHGGGGIEKEADVKQEIEIDNEIIHETFSNCQDVDIMDSGAVDHSSDSDYEPPTASADDLLAKAAAFAETNITENSDMVMRIKLESDIEKPNILKRKFTTDECREMKTVKIIREKYGYVPIVTRDGATYTCLVCQGEETVAGEAKGIIAHMMDAHEIRLYICDVCGEDFRKRNELSAHLDEHVATEEGDFQCEVCNRIFSNLRLFRIHKRMHYPQHKAWPCNTCGKKYSSKNLLDEHVNTHTGIRPYVCQTCGKDFASKYTFKAHEKTHEIRARPYQCNQCPKSFLSQQNLSQHERTHLGIKEYACHLCGKRFGSAHNLEVHSIVHTGYKPFACGLCGKAFARKAEIRDHERTHTGERPYQCEFCGATFSQRSNLQSHKRATHYDDKRHKCEECGKAFKRRRLLDYHLKAAHTGERPFKCTVCEATFVYPEHFKKHRRIHTGEKPFLCEVCGKAFNSRDNRNAHRFVHSDKKPYECLVCGTGFMRKPLLYQHMQAQGHLNDTIVVNQPRLTTDDDQLVTVNADGEMEIVDPSSVTEDSKLYIAEHVLADEDVMGEHEDGGRAVEHIIIDGQQISFAEDGEGELVGDEYEELITSDVLADGETQIIETPDGPMQLVKVRIPDDHGGEQEAWVKIVPE